MSIQTKEENRGKTPGKMNEHPIFIDQEHLVISNQIGVVNPCLPVKPVMLTSPRATLILHEHRDQAKEKIQLSSPVHQIKQSLDNGGRQS
jgi:hypothetical protein